MNVVIANVGIKQDSEGRYCLNDLHRAAGGERKHGPSLWMANAQTQELVSELGDTGNPVSVIKGGNDQGTFVCKELVYAYAMWISPTFHLKVIRTFDSMQTQAVIPNDPIIMLRMEQLDHSKRISMLEAKQATTVDPEHYTIAGWFRLQGKTCPKLSELSVYGKQATKISEGLGLPVNKVKDARYGYVNAYHQDVLAEVII